MFTWVKLPGRSLAATSVAGQTLLGCLFYITDQSTYAYVDDVLIATATPEELLQHLHSSSNVSRSMVSSLILRSAHLEQTVWTFSVITLTIVVLLLLRTRFKQFATFPSQPSSNRKLREFIGLVNFYHRFLPHCADLMHPLHALLSSTTKTPWTDDTLAAFNAIKDALANATLLSYPKPDAPTCLMTDASDTEVGAVLQQHNGAWHPISFFSKKMKPAETLLIGNCSLSTLSSNFSNTSWKDIIFISSPTTNH